MCLQELSKDELGERGWNDDIVNAWAVGDGNNDDNDKRKNENDEEEKRIQKVDYGVGMSTLWGGGWIREATESFIVRKDN